MYRKRFRLMLCMVSLNALLIGCSSSDDGRVAELEGQLDVSEAARLTAEQDRDTAKTAQVMAENARMEAEADLQESRDARMAAEQTLADREYDAAVASAVERVSAWNLRYESNPDDGPPDGISGWLLNTEAFSDTGSEFAVVSQSHADGDNIVMAVPWHDGNGELQFFVLSDPVRNPLHEVGVYPASGIWTEQPDIDGVTTSYEPIQSHGLGEEWQGFDLMKAYDGHGTWKVRLFADFGESDVLAEPDDSELIGRDGYGHQILLSDERMPESPSGPPGRDWVYIIIPEDGLQGSLDGVAGTFSCAGAYWQPTHQRRCFGIYTLDRFGGRTLHAC